jgi:hypothetical protein
LNKQQLNSLVASYKEGDNLALSKLFSEIHPLIERASLEVEPFVDNFTKFDCRVITEVKRQIDTFEHGKHDFLATVKTIISQSKARFIKRNSRNKEAYVSMTSLEGDGDENLGYQFKSLASTEGDVLFKEQAALLAQGNPIKKFIIDQWSKGADNKSISEMLAHRFGGKSESHRKTIQRFKNDCKVALSSDVL